MPPKLDWSNLMAGVTPHEEPRLVASTSNSDVKPAGSAATVKREIESTTDEITSHANDPAAQCPPELLSMNPDTRLYTADEILDRLNDISRWKLHLDSTSSKLTDRVIETMDAMNELAKTAVTANIGFARTRRNEIKPGDSTAKKMDLVNGPKSLAKTLAKATGVLNADPTFSGQKNSPEIMEHLMITSSLYYARMKNVELPKVYQETRALREDKVKEQKELERIGEHNEVLDTDIADLDYCLEALQLAAHSVSPFASLFDKDQEGEMGEGENE